MLEAPTTVTPFFIAARISRWATADSWWKTPSIRPMMVCAVLHCPEEVAPFCRRAVFCGRIFSATPGQDWARERR